MSPSAIRAQDMDLSIHFMEDFAEGSCDEAHFLVECPSTNKTAAFKSEANPQVYVKTPLHPEKLTVWCAFGARWNPSSKTMKATTRSQW
ncbi:hypothetical protein TNCV_3796501 [Trichonephila clavipes]|nr:hypothetical protein TNCV_3796501 [Trichonephila clavipes]